MAESVSSPGSSLVRKALVTAVTGILTFAVSQALDEPISVTLIQQLILSTMIGGLTLLTQFLHDFDRRVQTLESRQADNLAEIHRLVGDGFTRINTATAFYSHLERSALRSDTLAELVHRAGRIDASRAELLRGLADHELERLSFLLKCLGDGNEVFYDGEDRDWLLGLARHVRTSIDATSLATVDGAGSSFGGGIWMNDLGGRYLDLQRNATERGVRIRRIFVFDQSPALMEAEFQRVYPLHEAAGVEVRALDSATIPHHLKSMVLDFVVFDGVLSYEMTPATWIGRNEKAPVITTRLVLEPDRVHRRVARFEELWRVARPVHRTLALPDTSPQTVRSPDQLGSATERPAKA